MKPLILAGALLAACNLSSAWLLFIPTKSTVSRSLSSRLASSLPSDDTSSSESHHHYSDVFFTSQHELFTRSVTLDNAVPLSFYQLSSDTPHYSLVAAQAAAQATHQWAAHFVAQHQLCPWADRSVHTKNALQLFVLSCDDDDDGFERNLENIATQLHENLSSGRSDPNTAIVFCVLVPPSALSSKGNGNQHWTDDFMTFYDWYLAIEDSWFDLAENDASHVSNVVTLAPFHPAWQFADDNTNGSMEKQSPYPTISLVSTRVIERAGEAATRQIAESNRQILASKTPEEWTQIYQQAVYGKNST